jgi:ABC-type bacteriocin/lantibiotic exporter with double-glycine peptidase domain
VTQAASRSIHHSPADHAGASSSVWADAVVDALEALAKSARLSVSRTALRRCVQVAVGAEPAAAWPELLRSAGATVGLSVRLYQMNGVEVMAHGRRLPPLVTLVEGPRGPNAVVLRPEGDTLTVSEGAARTRPRRADMRGLVDLIGGADVSVVFAAADPAASLDVLRTSVTSGTPLGRLVALLRLEKDDLLVTVVYAIAVGLLSLATPLGVQTLVNTVAFGALLQPLLVITALLFAGLVFAGILNALQAWVVERVQQRLFVRTALDLAHRLPRVDASAFRHAHGPELVNRFFDVVTMQKGAATLLVDGIAIALQLLVGMLILSLYHPYLLAFAVLLAGFLAFIVFGLGRGATPSAVRESKAKYAVAAWLQDIARHRTTFGSELGAELGVTRAEDLTREWLSHRREHFSVVFRQLAGALVLQSIASAALLGVGGALVIAKQLTLGQLVAAELIVTAVVAGFSKLGKFFESFYDLLASVDKLSVLVDLPLERTGARAVEDGPASIAFGDLRVERGGRHGVHVEDGAQADRLADVLSADVAPREPPFEIDRIDTRDLSPAAIRSMVFVARKPEIFAGTLAENLTRGAPASRAELNAALDLVGARRVVDALPEATGTPLVTDAPTLGHEAAVRLTLARAVLARPRVLVVDRLVDGLPQRVRHELIDALARPEHRWTLVVLTTDPGAARRLTTTSALHGRST